jgi:hypothetical protein
LRKAVGSIAGDADKALTHGLTPSHGSDKRRSSGAWAGSTRPRHPLSSLAQNHLRAQTRQPGLGSAECLWRRVEPLARSRRRRLRARWRGVHFRSPDRSGVLLAVRGAPCVAASPFYSDESLASRRTGRAQNTRCTHSGQLPGAGAREMSESLPLTSSNHDSPPSDRLQI